MIKCFLISDSEGHAYYKKSYDNSFDKVDSNLLGGLISAISTFSKELLNKRLARIYFGDKMAENLTIIPKSTFNSHRSIYFIFFSTNNLSISLMKEISSAIYIETKSFLINSAIKNNPHLSVKAEKIIKKYDNQLGIIKKNED